VDEQLQTMTKRTLAGRVWNRFAEIAARKAGRVLYKPHVVWWNNRRWLAPFTQDVVEDRILDRRFTLVEFAKLARNLRGHTAECGVYTGIGSAMICRALADTYQPGEEHFAIDSFEGMSAPTEDDRQPGLIWSEGDLASPMEVAGAKLQGFDFAHLVKGWIPDAFSSLPRGGRYRLLHIDVDLYQPTLETLGYFYPRMVPGGVLVFDDHGFQSCPGARSAAERFFRDKPEPIVELATGQAVVMRQTH
jgi:O-methyltransferase